MRVQLAQQAQDIIGQNDLVVITERVDDVALLIAQMVAMGWPEVLDRHIPRHWKQRGLSWGWTGVIWLAYILTEGDHRKVSVEAYIAGMQHTLNHLSGQAIAPLDFSDDRLTHLLNHLSKPRYWHGIERDLNARSIEVYALSQDVIRCDATTVSGEHEVTAGGLLQCGHSKDDPTRPQIKIMLGSLDPLGMPLSTEVLSGERADDGLYIPVIERIRAGLNKTGLLFVGDCKMSALETRTHIAGRKAFYLSPLPLTGATAAAMEAWITAGVVQGEEGKLERIFRTNDRGHEILAAEGYEFERTCRAKDRKAQWPERVLMVRSPMHASQQAVGLETRLAHAEKKLATLTPPRGRGKRQITDEATLVEAISTVLKEHRVEGLLSLQWEKQTERTTQYVGRGRGSASRHRFTHSPVWVEGLCHQHHARAAVFEGCRLVLPPRIPYRTHLQSPQEPCAYRAAVCQAQRPNRGPHVPVDARRPRADGYGVYAAAVSAKRSSQTPRFAPRKQAQDDRQADGGADPESVCTCVPDHRKECCRRGDPALADTLVSVARGNPATAGVRYCSLPAACNSAY